MVGTANNTINRGSITSQNRARLVWFAVASILLSTITILYISRHKTATIYDSSLDSNLSQSPPVSTINNTAVTVNGRSVVLPANGSYENSTSSGNNTTSTSVHSSQSTSSTSAGVSNNSSTTVNVSSSSDSEGGSLQ